MKIDDKILVTLNGLAQTMATDIKKLIKLNGAYASGTLYNSVKAKALKTSEGHYSIEIDYVYYGLFVEKGRNPSKPTGGVYQSGKYKGQPIRKLPPLGSIKEWLRFKGLPQDMAYPIAIGIAQHGYKGKSFMKGKGVDIIKDYSVIGKILTEMGKTFKDDITDQIMRDTQFFGVPGIPKGAFKK